MSDASAAQAVVDDGAAPPAGDERGPSKEERARSMGWRPKEEYRGTNPWVDADEFIRRGEEELPVLRERYRKLDDRFVRTEKELAQVKTVLTEFRDFASKGEERAYIRAKRELEERRDTAVAHADTDTFRATQAELDELEQSRRAPRVDAAPIAAPVQNQPDPAVIAWVRDNPWFNVDPEAADFARATHDRILRSEPGISMPESLAKVRDRVKARFPEHFDNPRREQPSTVATPAGGGVKKAAKSYDNLPADAKAACDKFVRTIPGYTKDEYVKSYDWGD